MLGVARVPREHSTWGSVVQVLTAAGTLTLDDTVVRYAEVRQQLAQGGEKLGCTFAPVAGMQAC